MALHSEYATALGAIANLSHEEIGYLSKAPNEVLAKLFDFYIDASKRMQAENSALRQEVNTLALQKRSR